jgi:hypothetical protein
MNYLFAFIAIHIGTMILSGVFVGKFSDTKSSEYRFKDFQSKYIKLSYILVPIYVGYIGWTGRTIYLEK